MKKRDKAMKKGGMASVNISPLSKIEEEANLSQITIIPEF